jgi:lipopolysaccharide biosynthesis regulator YciM
MIMLARSTWEWSAWVWGLLLAFALGWISSRWDSKQGFFEGRRSRRAYFKGLCLLLDEQHDQAVDALIEAARHDTDAVDLHFTLGRLFRHRGEYERAVRIHTHLLDKFHLKNTDRLRAQYALAQDFLKAGLLDQAGLLLNELRGSSWNTQALEGLLYIAEKTRDWPQAHHLLEQMTQLGLGDFAVRRAHYFCEQALAVMDVNTHQTPSAAADWLVKARQVAPLAPRPFLEQSAYWASQGQIEQATQGLVFGMEQALARGSSTHLPLFARALASLSGQTRTQTSVGLNPNLVDATADVVDVLRRAYERYFSMDVLQAWVAFQPSLEQPYRRHLQAHPHVLSLLLWLTHEALLTSDLTSDAKLNAELKKALIEMTVPLLRYRCAACGFESRAYFWNCPACQTWDSYGTCSVGEGVLAYDGSFT